MWTLVTWLVTLTFGVLLVLEQLQAPVAPIAPINVPLSVAGALLGVLWLRPSLRRSRDS